MMSLIDKERCFKDSDSRSILTWKKFLDHITGMTSLSMQERWNSFVRGDNLYPSPILVFIEPIDEPVTSCNRLDQEYCTDFSAVF